MLNFYTENEITEGDSDSRDLVITATLSTAFDKSVTVNYTTQDDTATANESGECSYWCIAHLWIVPAKVEGVWQMGNGRLTLKQKYQMLSGSLEAGGQATAVTGRLRGDQISFSAGGAEYTGRVNGSTIEGSIRGGSGGSWTATRLSGR